MKINKTLIGLILLSIVGTLMVYQSLPDTIPIHWNFNGEVDNTGSKSMAFFTAVLPLLIYLLMKVAPKIDPKKASYDKHMGSYTIVAIAITVLLIGLHWVALIAALGYDINMGMFVKAGVGILFIVIGNLMPQFRHNYFVGIRMPWTLASEENWRKTHRFGGYAFVLMGIVFFIAAFFQTEISGFLSFGALIIAMLAIAVYSYMEFSKERKHT